MGIELLLRSSYVLITEDNPDHLDKSISAAIPLAFNCLCNLIMPEKMNEYYKFKSVITYEKEIGKSKFAGKIKLIFYRFLSISRSY